MESIKPMTITGVKVNYYFICKTKLWLFSHNIQMEKESEDVLMGKLLYESRYGGAMKTDTTVTIDITASAIILLFFSMIS